MTQNPKITTQIEGVVNAEIGGGNAVEKEQVSLRAQIGGALLAFGLSTGIVQAQEKPKEGVQVAENLTGPKVAQVLGVPAVVLPSTIDGTITGSINRQQTELEKSGLGTYDGIIGEYFLNNKKLGEEVTLIASRDCEKYLLSLPVEKRVKEARVVRGSLRDFLGFATNEAKQIAPDPDSVEFLAKYAPGIILAFPDNKRLKSYKDLVIVTQREKQSDEGLKKADEGLKKADEGLKKADEGLKKADEGLKKATQDLERAKELNKKLGGKG